MAWNLSRLGRVDELGRLFVTNGPVPAGSFLNGMHLNLLGAVRYTLGGGPYHHVNGVPMIDDAIGFDLGGVIDHYLNGLPRNLDGAIVGQINNIPTLNDSFVGKIRVGPLGGVYLVDLTPAVLTAWSNGFSNGFGL